MCFDVPKVVRSPGCDHGHDVESRNGRDINIDILDDYIWTPEWFLVRDNTGAPGGYRNPPGGIWALMGFSGKEGKGAREGAPPPQAQSKLGGGPAPLSFLPPSSPFLPHLLVGQGKEGVLLPVGVGLLLARPSWPAAPPPLLLYIRGQGAPLDTTTIDP